MSHYLQKTQTKLTTTAGNSVTLWDDMLAGGQSRFTATGGEGVTHVEVTMLLDQVVTFLHYWAPDPDAKDADLKVINGTFTGGVHTGEDTTAGVFFQRMQKRVAGRNKLVAVMGGTAPTANKIAVRSCTFPGVTQ